MVPVIPRPPNESTTNAAIPILLNARTQRSMSFSCTPADPWEITMAGTLPSTLSGMYSMPQTVVGFLSYLRWTSSHLLFGVTLLK